MTATDSPTALRIGLFLRELHSVLRARTRALSVARLHTHATAPRHAACSTFVASLTLCYPPPSGQCLSPSHGMQVWLGRTQRCHSSVLRTVISSRM